MKVKRHQADHCCSKVRPQSGMQVAIYSRRAELQVNHHSHRRKAAVTFCRAGLWVGRHYPLLPKALVQADAHHAQEYDRRQTPAQHRCS